jgi:hypothetical protein
MKVLHILFFMCLAVMATNVYRDMMEYRPCYTLPHRYYFEPPVATLQPTTQEPPQKTTYPDLPCHWINGRPIQPEDDQPYTAGPWEDTTEFRDVNAQEDTPPQLSEEQAARIHIKKQLDPFPVMGTVQQPEEDDDSPACGDEYDKLFAAGVTEEEEQEMVASLDV